MSEELAWTAGLFDGEGTIFASRHNRRDRSRVHVRLHMALSMTTESVVRRFHAVVIVGNVVSLAPDGPNCKPQWRWQATSDGDVRTAFAAIEPWLSEPKLNQAREAFDARASYLAVPPPPLPLHQQPKPFCKRGHNQSIHRYVAPGGGRYCRACVRVRNEERKRKMWDAPLLNSVSEDVA